MLLHHGLLGEYRFAGKAGALRVKHVWLEDGVKRTKKLDTAVAGCMKRLAKFNGCKDVVFEA